MADPKVSIATRVDPKVYNRLKAHLGKTGVKMQWLLDKAIEEYLDRHEKRAA